MRKAIIKLLLVLVVGNLCFSNVIPVAPNEKDIQGSWVGVPHEANDYCRLVLTNGVGLFARGFEFEKPMLYTVRSYRVDGKGKVTFDLFGTSANAYRILVTGRATHNEIRIVIGSPDGGWSHGSVLYREETVERMLGELRKSMEELEKHK